MIKDSNMPLWLRTLLRPGVRLMQRLRLQAKLALVGTAMVVPLLLLMSVQVAQLLHARAQVLQAQQGLATHSTWAPLLEQVQDLRTAQLQLLAGKAELVATRDALRADLAAAAQRAETPLAPADAALRQAWQPAQQALLALAQRPQATTSAEALKGHAQAVQLMQDLLRFNAQRSGLTDDAAPRSRRPAALLVGWLARAPERVSMAQGLGLAALQRGSTHERERTDLLAIATAIEELGVDLQVKLQAWNQAGGQPPQMGAQVQMALAEWALALRATFGTPTPTGDAQAFAQSGNHLQHQINRLRDDTQGLLHLVYAEQKAALEKQLLAAGLAFGAALAAMAYLLVSFAMNFQSSVRGLRRATDAMAAGNLAHRANVYGRDELADIGTVMDRMSLHLSTMVAEIRNSATLVNLTGQQVSSGSARLAQRTDDQAGSLRNSITAINELAVTVASNAQAAQQLDGLTAQLTVQADEGNTAMRDTMQAVAQMRQASGRVAEVVAVIDDLAFQTGMLSLNAAIEAARAGEAGKGFAVVASEVRQLAQRCGESAEEIRKLIGDAGAQVDESSQKISHVSAALDAIVAGVRQVSQQLRGISHSSAEQSAGLAAVTSSVGSLDEITRDNAALAEESSTASHALVQRAVLLRQAVGSMQLRQGSAEEALALVKKAAAHFHAVGPEQAARDFHNAQGAFLDRDLYIFMLDRHGRYAAVGNDPGKVGQSFSTVPGLDRDYLERVWAAADSGGGWVAYHVMNPMTQLVTPKESYMMACGPDLVIGCGIYRTDLSHQLSDKPRATAWPSRKGKPLERAAA